MGRTPYKPVNEGVGACFKCFCTSPQRSIPCRLTASDSLHTNSLNIGQTITHNRATGLENTSSDSIQHSKQPNAIMSVV